MSMDFTVIQPMRQRFGGKRADSINPPDRDLGAPTVGGSEEYVFSCPNVDPMQWAVLQFQSIAVSLDWNILRINDIEIPGGLQPGGAHHTFQGTRLEIPYVASPSGSPPRSR